jgi:hypothetical protein
MAIAPVALDLRAAKAREQQAAEEHRSESTA